MSNLNVIVSSYTISGPIKGAIALANGLVNEGCHINLFFFQGTRTEDLNIDSRVNTYFLDDLELNFFKKIQFLNNFIKNKKCKMISFGFSADIVNVILTKKHISISSVRGNLFKNYKYDYGFLGVLLSFLHYFVISRSNHILSMSVSMYHQILKITNRESIIIGNFIDELNLKKYKLNKVKEKKNVRFIFIGSLSKRKNIIFLINVFADLVKIDKSVSLDIVGLGPKKNDCENLVQKLNLSDFIKIHGFIKNPYRLLNESDVLVLPSYSEGVSRASLEALYFNKICVMFDVDANNELIKNGFNGYLSKRNEDFLDCLIKSIHLSKKVSYNLLPLKFRQKNQVNSLIKFLKNI